MAAAEIRAEVSRQELEKGRDVAGFHREPAVHISLADRELRIEQDRPFGGLVVQANDDTWPLDDADLMGPSVGVNDRQVPVTDDFPQNRDQ